MRLDACNAEVVSFLVNKGWPVEGPPIDCQLGDESARVRLRGNRYAVVTRDDAGRLHAAYADPPPGGPIIDQQTAREAVYALLTLLDGEQDHDLEYSTGLPPERCREICNLRGRLYERFGQDWLASLNR
jgi:hypothetical protein